MAADKEKEAKLKALQLTLDKLDKSYGKGTVMKMVVNIVLQNIHRGLMKNMVVVKVITILNF